MNILGVGTLEIVMIFIIMLVVAGPERMICWAYILGQYVAKAKQLWRTTMAALEAELREAGIEVDLPDKPPTKASVNRFAVSMLDSLAAPAQEVTAEINKAQREFAKLGHVEGLLETVHAQEMKTNLSDAASAPELEAAAQTGQQFGTWASYPKTEE